ncbi:MAG: DUF2520 domain-containing protein, partial [candidate division WOR-3 bacterium]
RVGLTVGYFIKKNRHFLSVYDKDSNAMARAIHILKIKDNPGYRNFIEQCNILLFATPDDEILNAFKKAKKYITHAKYLFHFSGLLPAEIFPKSRNIYRASIHPFAAFPQIRIPPRRNKYILFFQGDRKSLEIAQAVFSEKYFSIRTINKKQKPLYHLLGTFSSNLLVALSKAIKQIMTDLKWKEKDFDEIVCPMLMETINDIKEYGIDKGLSGPIVRGDLKTVGKHLKVLKSNAKLYDIYSALSRIIIEYAPARKQKAFKQILHFN